MTFQDLTPKKKAKLRTESEKKRLQWKEIKRVNNLCTNLLPEPEDLDWNKAFHAGLLAGLSCHK